MLPTRDVNYGATWPTGVKDVEDVRAVCVYKPGGSLDTRSTAFTTGWQMYCDCGYSCVPLGHGNG